MFADSVNSATPIRFPSTANLNINSRDRLINNSNTISTAADFTITQQTNILSGYFTRLAIVEMVMNWGIPNISTANGNDELIVTVGSQSETVLLNTGFYTVSAVMREIVEQLNDDFDNPNIVFSFTGNPGSKSFECNNAAGNPVLFTISDSILATQLGLTTDQQISDDLIVSPYLIPKNLFYLDFVSPQLTYQQGLKDATTSPINRDVLYRWNFGWDSPSELDPDGYPIQQGYTAFVQRRYLSFPKQIKWTGTQPIGQLSFQLYGSDGQAFVYNAFKYDLVWSMNILVSES
jgi:hypothetical protein